MIAIGAKRRLVFCIGVGGVGKTTFVAALGLREAREGRSVLILTADPARRLADALGVHTLSNEPSRISLPVDAKGELHAAMLETKASADAIIRRAAGDDVRAQRVFDNEIYQALSNTLARSHAYAAMERVYEAINDARYDLVVVDTPPSQSALEILNAPARLVRFLDQRVVRWFLEPADEPRLRGGALTRRLLSAIAGESLVDSLTGFLSEMAFLREGFSERARDVRDQMRSPTTEFVLVASADPAGVRAARSVAEAVEERGFSIGHVVFNRAFMPAAVGLAEADVEVPEALADLVPTLDRMVAWALEEQSERVRAVSEFAGRRGASAWVLPESTRALGNVVALSAWVAAALPADALG